MKWEHVEKVYEDFLSTWNIKILQDYNLVLQNIQKFLSILIFGLLFLAVIAFIYALSY